MSQGTGGGESGDAVTNADGRMDVVIVAVEIRGGNSIARLNACAIGFIKKEGKKYRERSGICHSITGRFIPVSVRQVRKIPGI